MFEVYKQTCINRHFELNVLKAYNDKKINAPIYLGVGQEHIAACIAQLCKGWSVFPQHRCHSYGLSFGISPLSLAKEILGRQDGINCGMGGSASFGDHTKGIFGHSGLLGDQVPIATGHALIKPTICVLGDAAAEEDYVFGALGFAATHNLPILYVCEDNNLSILTEKKVRRSWNIVDVAKGFGINAIDIDDKPETILNTIIKTPMLININTERHLWHCGTGQDSDPKTDRLLEMKQKYGEALEKDIKKRMDNLWASL